MNDQIRKGAWIASTKRHLDRMQYSPETAQFRATEIAGKSVSLLSLMQADQAERITPQALNAYCIAAKIRPMERDVVLEKLAGDGQIEVLRSDKEVVGVDVFVFSREDVLRSASRIFDGASPSANEVANIDALERVCLLPRTKSELVEYLTGAGFEEPDALLTIELQRQLQLVGVDSSPALDEPIIFNEHAFVQKPSAIVAALSLLDVQERQSIQDIQHEVEEVGCSAFEQLAGRFPLAVLRAMEGLGLIDKQQVISPFGNLDFATLPQTFGVYGGDLGMAADCFHHAKMLLCCLRYGVIKSVGGRGRIVESTWILSKLLSGTEVGPCTAIGQDYGILEKEGIVQLRRAVGRFGEQYFMRLRKREVGELAMQVLTCRRGLTGTGASALPTEIGHNYVDPQTKRAQTLALPTRGIGELHAKILTSLRT